MLDGMDTIIKPCGELRVRKIYFLSNNRMVLYILWRGVEPVNLSPPCIK